jgi:hypothetical protein
MEVKSFEFAENEDLQKQWEKIFNILKDQTDAETLLMMVLINKSLEETCGRRIEADDFFHEVQLLEALKLLEHWLDSKSYFLSKVH